MPRNHGPNTTALLASMSLEGVEPCLAVIGTTTAAVIEAYNVEHVLCPSPKSNHVKVVVMDDLSAHEGGRVKELIEQGVRSRLPVALLLAGP